MSVFEYQNKVVCNEHLPLNYSQEDKLTSSSVQQMKNWLLQCFVPVRRLNIE